MNIEDLVSKVLIAIVSALLGWYTTTRIAKAKERKEDARKQLEALYELQKINYKLFGSFFELQHKLQIYVSSSVEKEGYSAIIVTDMIKKCSDELAELNVVSLSHAIHMKQSVFDLVRKTHEEARINYLSVTKGNRSTMDGVLKIYSEENVFSLEKVIGNIEILQRNLLEKEKKYVEQYMKKYNKNL
ncbi:TPA: hypothetical protein RKT18_005566 [Bacillus cereus]|nr:hypothetical protein [Bacillus cereus]HDV8364367.1 hypothetical protein [Bacillus cereus]